MQKAFSIRYALAVCSADGTVKETRTGHNLVMRSKISSFFRTNTPISKFQAGQGTTVPNVRDSGAITFTNAWTDAASAFTVTASAGFFVSQDVGRLLKLDSGEELAITGYTSTTVVTVAAYPTAPTATQQGTVWYDNQTALESIISQWGTTGTNFSAASNALTVTTGASGTASLVVTQTAQTSVASSGYTVSEIGWADGGGNLIGRAYLTSPVACASGDYVTCTLTITYTVDCTSRAVSASGTYGDFSGVSRFYGAASGDTLGVLCVGTASLSLSADAIDLSTIHNTSTGAPTTQTVYASTSTVSTAYPSTVIDRWSGTFGTGPGMTIRSILAFGIPNAHNWAHNLTASVSKSSLQSVSVTYDFTLTRTLVN